MPARTKEVQPRAAAAGAACSSTRTKESQIKGSNRSSQISAHRVPIRSGRAHSRRALQMLQQEGSRRTASFSRRALQMVQQGGSQRTALLLSRSSQQLGTHGVVAAASETGIHTAARTKEHPLWTGACVIVVNLKTTIRLGVDLKEANCTAEGLEVGADIKEVSSATGRLAVRDRAACSRQHVNL